MKWLLLVLTLLTWKDGARLPAWASDELVWHAAFVSDPQSPWAIDNCVHTAVVMSEHQQEQILLWGALQGIPRWMPDEERQPYLDAEMSLAGLYEHEGRLNDAQIVMNHALKRAPKLWRWRTQ